MLKIIFKNFIMNLINFIRLVKSCIFDALRSFKSIFVVMFYSKFNLPINKIRTEKHDECIVLGNAPSLNEVLINNSQFFVGRDKICVNQFARSEHFEKIKPEYYLFLDSAFWDKDASIKLKEMISSLCDVMAHKVTWPMKILLPVQARSWNMFIDVAYTNNNIEIFYFNMTHVSHSESLKYIFYKKNLAMPLAQNVLIAGIFIGLNIGYKTIYVLGADHTWHENIYIDDSNNLYCKEPHCYEKSEPKLIPFYVDIAETKRMKLHELLAALSKKFEGYVILEEYSRHIGSKIYNATNRSCIDAFERYKL